jgi:hypothetical protein
VSLLGGFGGALYDGLVPRVAVRVRIGCQMRETLAVVAVVSRAGLIVLAFAPSMFPRGGGRRRARSSRHTSGNPTVRAGVSGLPPLAIASSVSGSCDRARPE